jgi:WD40 repeat protein
LRDHSPAEVVVPTQKYDAFMSYSRAADMQLARRLHRLIVRVGLRRSRPRKLRIFHDERDVDLGKGLSSQLSAALDDSVYFIYLASPPAATSRFVDEEVKYWQQRHEDLTNFLIVLTEGGDVTDSDGAAFRSALPPSVADAFGSDVPVYADVRPVRDSRGRIRESPRLRQEAMKIAARLYGTSVDALAADDQRERRRTRRWLGAGLGIVCLALITALIASTVLVGQLQETAQAQQLALSRLLLQQAETTPPDDPGGLRLAIAADAVHHDASTESTLLSILTSTNHPHVLAGATDAIRSVAFTPDGSILASGDNSGAIILRDLASGDAPIAEMSIPGAVRSVCFIGDGSVLAAAGDGSAVTLWSLGDDHRQPRPLTTLTGHVGPITALAVSPDGATLATAGADRTIKLWDLANPATATLVGQIDGAYGDAVTSVAFAADSSLLAAGSSDGTVALWTLTDRTRPTETRRFTGPPVTTIGIEGARGLLATGSANGEVRVWDVNGPPDAAPSVLDSRVGEVFALAWSTRGDVLAAGGSGRTVARWDMTDPARPTHLGAPLDGPTAAVAALAFSADGSRLAAGGVDRRILLWSASDTTQPRASEPAVGHSAAVISAAFAGDEQVLITGSDDSTVRLWDVRSASPKQIGPILREHQQPVHAVATTRSGDRLAAASADGTVSLFDVTTPTDPRRINLIQTGGPVSSVAFDGPGEKLVTANFDGSIAVWDAADRAPRDRPLHATNAGAAVYAIAMLPDGRVVAGRANGQLLLWDPQTGSAATLVDAHTNSVTSMALSDDGRILGTASFDGTAMLWDLPEPGAPFGRRKAVLSGHVGWVRAIAFAPDGRTVATGGEDGQALLWDLTDPVQPRRIGLPLVAEGGAVRALVFDRDPGPARLALGVANGTAVVWNLQGLMEARSDAVRAACAVATRGLDDAEWQHSLPGIPFVETCPG